MSLVKIEVNFPEIAKTLETFSVNRKKAFGDIVNSFSSAISESFNALLHHEMEIYLGSEDQSDNKLNGYYARKYAILHLDCLSTRTLAMISQRLLGIEVSAKTVSNSLEVFRENGDYRPELKWILLSVI